MNSYEVSWVEFRTERLETYMWNHLDNYVCFRGESPDYPLIEVGVIVGVAQWGFILWKYFWLRFYYHCSGQICSSNWVTIVLTLPCKNMIVCDLFSAITCLCMAFSVIKVFHTNVKLLKCQTLHCIHFSSTFQNIILQKYFHLARG